ncbi:MAG TPA: hypothetical protein VLL76_01930 [Candidatus Omnitrophota bacterium]|nr:hypothetical protein [Candidatus Omnitrophota bacterium]
MKKFKDSIAGTAVAGPHLPVVHTTSAFAFDGIAETGLLEADDCNVYVGEKLLYFFYGRPAFRPNYGDKTTGQDQFAPVCLVMRADVAAAPRRVMPLDSGAFANRIMSDYHHPKMKKEGFELPPDLDSTRQVIGVYFNGSNSHYYEQDGASPATRDKRNWYVETYVSLIDRKAANVGDGRLTAIEIQLDKDVTLAGNVLAVALPHRLWEDPEIQALIKGWGAKELVYRIDTKFRPNEACAKIEDVVRDYLEDQGLL